ncbi:thioredoxin family protein [Pseudomonas costantinii]|uniref:Thioredoxin 1 n=1 Tax=Pseudomonas costantinii TaxID=168469 RepID=A0A1S2V2K3_9PSED|nr:thioredoxin family protein [Pseudomonas costantinii]NVZ23680.1 thioredoxin family protein [Pseudomonas costantinii]OIN52943.1 hypothetical protein BFL40_12160 [Pseudomonas costantinii]SEE50929.1 thioredoxin 1 [Pseudomonas costantinii]
MGIANAVINDHNEYQQMLDEHPLVIALFTAQSCHACMGVAPRFNRAAEVHEGRVKGLILDTAQTPKIDGVSGTPTLVVYKNAQVVDNIKGVVDPEYQDSYFEQLFIHYANGHSGSFTFDLPQVPTAPASPAAPPLPPR